MQALFDALPPPHELTNTIVVVPVCDEAASLPSMLAALQQQTNRWGCILDSRTYEILLFSNNCVDDSADVAWQFAQHHPHLRLHVVSASLPPDYAHVGWARRLLMDAAYQRLIVHNRTD